MDETFLFQVFMQRPAALRAAHADKLGRALRALADEGVFTEGEELVVTDPIVPGVLKVTTSSRDSLHDRHMKANSNKNPLQMKRRSGCFACIQCKGCQNF